MTVSGAATISNYSKMLGSGQTILKGATSLDADTSYFILDTRSLVNNGTLTWSAGYIYLYNAASLTNAAGGTFVAQAAGGVISGGDATAVTVSNAGTLNGQAGAQQRGHRRPVRQHRDRRRAVRHAQPDRGGGHSPTGRSRPPTSPVVNLANAAYNVSGTLNETGSGSLRLTGPATLNIGSTANYNWSGGTLDTTGGGTISNAGTITLSGTGSKTLLGVFTEHGQDQPDRDWTIPYRQRGDAHERLDRRLYRLAGTLDVTAGTLVNSGAINVTGTTSETLLGTFSNAAKMNQTGSGTLQLEAGAAPTNASTGVYTCMSARSRPRAARSPTTARSPSRASGP